MLSVADARAIVVAGVRLAPTEVVGLAAAHGRVLAGDVRARRTQPPAAVSAMDGYAVRAEDVATAPATLRVIGEAAAGSGFAATVGRGQAVRIFTGAPVPAGADAVVIQEHTEPNADGVVIGQPASPGGNVRPAGTDFCAGEVLLRAGRKLTARDVGLAAAMNVPWLNVRRRPRIACLATGDELVLPGEPLGLASVVDANGPLLASCIRAFGGEAVDLGIAHDDPAAVLDAVHAARGCDLLVTSGGASVGDRDLVRPALEAAGFALGFHRVAMRPGKPVLFGHLASGLPILGLPGNPVSAGVAALVFLRPAIAVMLGLDPGQHPPAESALHGRDLPANDHRQDYLRAGLSRNASGQLVATPFAQQDSAQLRRLSEADCLVVRPPHAPAARAGEPASILRFDPGC